MAHTSQGDLAARLVVLCTGAFQRADRPSAASMLPSTLQQLDLQEYRNEAGLPPGRVVIVGSGQSGCQLAEELHAAGRDVVLSCGRAPWAPRRLGDRDLVWWAETSGFLDQSVDALPSPDARLTANVLASGQAGGHDLHLRVLRSLGVTLVGHLVGTSEHEARFAPDLAETIAWSDARHRELMDLFRQASTRLGLAPLDVPEPGPFDASAPERVALDGVGALIFTGGFRPDHRAWLPWPDAFDADGFSIQHDAAGAVVLDREAVRVEGIRPGQPGAVVRTEAAGEDERPHVVQRDALRSGGVEGSRLGHVQGRQAQASRRLPEEVHELAMASVAPGDGLGKVRSEPGFVLGSAHEVPHQRDPLRAQHAQVQVVAAGLAGTPGRWPSGARPATGSASTDWSRNPETLLTTRGRDCPNASAPTVRGRRRAPRRVPPHGAPLPAGTRTGRCPR